MLFNFPICRNSQELLGYYVIVVSLDNLIEILGQSTLENSTIQLINKEGIILNNTDTKLIGSKAKNPWYIYQIKEDIKSVKNITTSKYQIIEKLAANRELYLAIDIPIQLINEPVNKVRNNILLVAIIGVLLSFITGYLLISWQLNPLKNLLTAFNSLGQGMIKEELLFKDKNAKRKDEIGMLSKAFNNMLSQLRTIIRNIIETAGNVSNSSQQLKTISNEIQLASQQVGNSIQEVATGAENQSASIEYINMKVKNLDQSIVILDKSNQNVETLAQDVDRATEDGQRKIEKVNQQMNSIKLSIKEVANNIKVLEKISNDIDDILEIINNIANQTNLLALNAAIEAARAGKYGKGYRKGRKCKELLNQWFPPVKKLPESILKRNLILKKIYKL